ncbi:murein L,D-transpeptidase catalytic domain family protein [Pontibacter sp. CAU 1760]
MLKVTLASLALGLLSFTSPLVSSPDVSRTLAPAADAALSDNMALLSLTEKEMAFKDYTLEVYNEANLQKKGLSIEVFEKALVGFQNLKRQRLVSPSKSVLTVIDFTKSSREKRLWIVDLKSKKLLFNTLVAHGRNTGEDKALNFSNRPNSYMSSLGFYLTDATYYGKHGLSLRLSGMDGKYNSNAMERAIVMHGADYATSDFVKRYGRLGRSLGCPAVPQEVSKDVIMAIKDKTVLYIHGNDSNYSSKYLDTTHAAEDYVKEHFATNTVAML